LFGLQEALFLRPLPQLIRRQYKPGVNHARERRGRERDASVRYVMRYPCSMFLFLLRMRQFVRRHCRRSRRREYVGKRATGAIKIAGAAANVLRRTRFREVA